MPHEFVTKTKSSPLEYIDKKVNVLDTPNENSTIRCEECKNAKAVTLEQRLTDVPLDRISQHHIKECQFTKVVYRCKFDPKYTYRTHMSTCEKAVRNKDVIIEERFANHAEQRFQHDIENARRIGI